MCHMEDGTDHRFGQLERPNSQTICTVHTCSHAVYCYGAEVPTANQHPHRCCAIHSAPPDHPYSLWRVESSVRLTSRGSRPESGTGTIAPSKIPHFACSNIPSSFRTSHCVRYLLVGMSCSRSAEGLRIAKIHDRSCSQLNVSHSARVVQGRRAAGARVLHTSSHSS